MSIDNTPSPAALAASFHAIETADGWHQLQTDDGHILAAHCLIVESAVVAVSIPIDSRPHPAIASALRKHVSDIDDDGWSDTIGRYQARAAAGSWSVSDDGTEQVINLRP